MQEEIHELLLSFAEAGATVVRLKGGDPLVVCYFHVFLVLLNMFVAYELHGHMLYLLYVWGSDGLK